MTSRRNNRTFLSQARDSVSLEIGGRAYGTLAYLWTKAKQYKPLLLTVVGGGLVLVWAFFFVSRDLTSRFSNPPMGICKDVLAGVRHDRIQARILSAP